MRTSDRKTARELVTDCEPFIGYVLRQMKITSDLLGGIKRSQLEDEDGLIDDVRSIFVVLESADPAKRSSVLDIPARRPHSYIITIATKQHEANINIPT